MSKKSHDFKYFMRDWAKNVFLATFCENALSQPPIVGQFSDKHSDSLYIYWLSLNFRNKLLVKRIILPKLSIICYLFRLQKRIRLYICSVLKK